MIAIEVEHERFVVGFRNLDGLIEVGDPCDLWVGLGGFGQVCPEESVEAPDEANDCDW
jgi:hypothetical protein